MPRFMVLSRVDSYSDYTTEVEADTREEAVDYAYDAYMLGTHRVTWEPAGVVEFDAVRMVALDENGDEIDGYSRGKG